MFVKHHWTKKTDHPFGGTKKTQITWARVCIRLGLCRPTACKHCANCKPPVGFFQSHASWIIWKHVIYCSRSEIILVQLTPWLSNVCSCSVLPKFWTKLFNCEFEDVNEPTEEEEEEEEEEEGGGFESLRHPVNWKWETQLGCRLDFNLLFTSRFVATKNATSQGSGQLIWGIRLQQQTILAAKSDDYDTRYYYIIRLNMLDAWNCEYNWNIYIKMQLSNFFVPLCSKFLKK